MTAEAIEKLFTYDFQCKEVVEMEKLFGLESRRINVPALPQHPHVSARHGGPGPGEQYL